MQFIFQDTMVMLISEALELDPSIEGRVKVLK